MFFLIDKPSRLYRTPYISCTLTQRNTKFSFETNAVSACLLLHLQCLMRMYETLPLSNIISQTANATKYIQYICRNTTFHQTNE